MSRRRVIKKEEVSQVELIKRRIREEKRQKQRIKRKRRLKHFFQLILIVSLVFGVYKFDQSKYSRIRKIEIEGNHVISKETLIEALDLKENERLIKAMLKKLTMRNKLDGVAKQHLKLYYTKGLINLTVEEFPAIAYIDGQEKGYLLADNALITNGHKLNQSVPILKNFTLETFTNFPQFADKLSRVDSSSFNSISEIEVIEKPLEEIYFRITMNNGFYVHTNLNNLLLLDYYPDIVSGILKGDKKENRCIYFLDYGHTDENQSALSTPEPCE